MQKQQQLSTRELLRRQPAARSDWASRSTGGGVMGTGVLCRAFPRSQPKPGKKPPSQRFQMLITSIVASESGNQYSYADGVLTYQAKQDYAPGAAPSDVPTQTSSPVASDPSVPPPPGDQELKQGWPRVPITLRVGSIVNGSHWDSSLRLEDHPEGTQISFTGLSASLYTFHPKDDPDEFKLVTSETWSVSTITVSAGERTLIHPLVDSAVEKEMQIPRLPETKDDRYTFTGILAETCTPDVEILVQPGVPEDYIYEPRQTPNQSVKPAPQLQLRVNLTYVVSPKPGEQTARQALEQGTARVVDAQFLMRESVARGVLGVTNQEAHAKLAPANLPPLRVVARCRAKNTLELAYNLEEPISADTDRYGVTFDVVLAGYDRPKWFAENCPRVPNEWARAYFAMRCAKHGDGQVFEDGNMELYTIADNKDNAFNVEGCVYSAAGSGGRVPIKSTHYCVLSEYHGNPRQMFESKLYAIFAVTSHPFTPEQRAQFSAMTPEQGLACLAPAFQEEVPETKDLAAKTAPFTVPANTIAYFYAFKLPLVEPYIKPSEEKRKATRKRTPSRKS